MSCFCVCIFVFVVCKAYGLRVKKATLSHAHSQRFKQQRTFRCVERKRIANRTLLNMQKHETLFRIIRPFSHHSMIKISQHCSSKHRCACIYGVCVFDARDLDHKTHKQRNLCEKVGPNSYNGYSDRPCSDSDRVCLVWLATVILFFT